MRSIERNDRVLTMSSFSKKEIQDLLGILEEKISIIYPATVCSEQATDFLTVSNQYRILRPYILYVGTIEPRKNLFRLIRAFRHLKETYKLPHQLVLAGGNRWNSKEIHRTGNEKLGDENAVCFAGYVAQSEKNALYKNADVFAFPSLYKGFGIPPLEAMNFGCPVVCSNATSLPEEVGKAAEFVGPFVEDSIAEGIWKVLTNSEYAKELIQEGYAQTKKLTWEKSAEQLTQVCQEMLGA